MADTIITLSTDINRTWVTTTGKKSAWSLSVISQKEPADGVFIVSESSVSKHTIGLSEKDIDDLLVVLEFHKQHHYHSPLGEV
jgi:hypothetical protein